MIINDILKEKKRLKAVRKRNIYVRNNNYKVKTKKSKLQKTMSGL